jgi:dCTP deaminase
VSALSKKSLVAELTSGRLVVSPILSDTQIGKSSIDLRMGTIALMARAGAQSHVNPTAYANKHVVADGFDSNDVRHALIRDRQQKHERFCIPFHNSFLLHPGSLVLVPTLEWIRIPSTLQGVVTARSSWAREGLNIATATIINPDYRGIITLELANFGEIPIRLFPGLRLAQLALYRLEGADATNESKSSDSQFDLSFEPCAGNIAKSDERFFLPKQEK